MAKSWTASVYNGGGNWSSQEKPLPNSKMNVNLLASLELDLKLCIEKWGPLFDCVTLCVNLPKFEVA